MAGMPTTVLPPACSAVAPRCHRAFSASGRRGLERSRASSHCRVEQQPVGIRERLSSRGPPAAAASRLARIDGAAPRDRAVDRLGHDPRADAGEPAAVAARPRAGRRSTTACSRARPRQARRQPGRELVPALRPRIVRLQRSARRRRSCAARACISCPVARPIARARARLRNARLRSMSCVRARAPKRAGGSSARPRDPRVDPPREVAGGSGPRGSVKSRRKSATHRLGRAACAAQVAAAAGVPEQDVSETERVTTGSRPGPSSGRAGRRRTENSSGICAGVPGSASGSNDAPAALHTVVEHGVVADARQQVVPHHPLVVARDDGRGPRRSRIGRGASGSVSRRRRGCGSARTRGASARRRGCRRCAGRR